VVLSSVASFSIVISCSAPPLTDSLNLALPVRRPWVVVTSFGAATVRAWLKTMPSPPFRLESSVSLASVIPPSLPR